MSSSSLAAWLLADKWMFNALTSTNHSYMVKHIILWKLKSELTPAQKNEAAKAIKEGLEGLKGQVPGLVDIHVQIDGRLESSNVDIMLDSTLENEEALRNYAVHPAHVAVANGVVRPNTELRTCLDFELPN